MLSAIFQVYQFYKSDKKLLGTTVSRQKSLIQFQFSSLFSDLIILINTPKKVFKCEIPINITPLECFQLYLKSKKPIKVTESYWEQFFQQGNEEFFAQKKFSRSKIFFKKKIFFFKSENPKDFRVLNCSLGPSAYSNPIKSGKNEWEQCFFSTNVSEEILIFFAF